MNRLLSFELRKTRKQRSFYICTAVMVLLLVLPMLMSYLFLKTESESFGEIGLSGIGCLIGAANNSSFILIVGIFTALTVCEDYEQQTIKTVFARGYSRRRVYFAKLVSAWIVTTVMFAAVELSAFVFGSLFFGAGEAENLRFIGILCVQYVVCMAYVSLFYALSSIIRKNGFSIAATIVLPMLVGLLLSLIDSFLENESFSLASIWLSSFLSDVSAFTVSNERLLGCLFASICYIAAFVLGGMYFNKKTEL